MPQKADAPFTSPFGSPPESSPYQEILVDEEEKTLDKERYKQDTELKGKLFAHIIKIIWVWIVSTITIFTLIGCGLLDYDTSIVIVFLSTTTANVIAMGILIIKSLFPNNRY